MYSVFKKYTNIILRTHPLGNTYEAHEMNSKIQYLFNLPKMCIYLYQQNNLLNLLKVCLCLIAKCYITYIYLKMFMLAKQCLCFYQGERHKTRHIPGALCYDGTGYLIYGSGEYGQSQVISGESKVSHNILYLLPSHSYL